MSNHKFDEQALKTELASKFTQYNDILETMLMAHEMVQRGSSLPPYQIWYGPGGYGKTALSKIFLKHLTGQEPGVKALSALTLPAELFGGYDMQQLISKGDLRMMIEKSVFGYKSFVLEEGLQAPPDTMNALKYFLLEGIQCEGGQCFLLEAKHGIIATNGNPFTWAEGGDNPADANALLERFPFKVEVVWKTHTAYDYLDALNKQHPDPKLKGQREEVAELAGISAANGKILSPRTVCAQLFHAYCIDPMSAIKHLTVLDDKTRSLLVSNQKNVSEYAKVRGLAIKANQLNAIQLDKIARQDLPAVAATVQKLIEELENLSISYSSGSKDHYDNYEKAVKTSRKVHEDIIKRITNPGKLLVTDIEGLVKLYGKQ